MTIEQMNQEPSFFKNKLWKREARTVDRLTTTQYNPENYVEKKRRQRAKLQEPH